MCDAFGSNGHHAMPLVTTVDNRVPMGRLVATSGPRFTIATP
jgi:hypothetical protein